MGLDIYVGPLTRYYLGDWETVIQRLGRERGMPVKVVRPQAAEENVRPALTAEEATELVIQWRTALTESLASNLEEPLSWMESADGEYFTDKPAWDGYGSLVMLAAYEEHPELPRPKISSADFPNDAAWKASTAEGFRSRYTTILQPELWLPCRLPFAFRAPDAAGNVVWIGSSRSLLDQLRALNEATVRGTREQLAQWRRENFDQGASFEEGSRFGLAMFTELAEKSVLLGQPMKMDY
jgi:hypothetical protein